MFPTLEGVRYNPDEHKPRDVKENKRLCEIAEHISKKLVDGTNISKEETEILTSLRKQNVHAHMNPFHYAPMGSNNDIYIANPPDTLHLFCAGLMKALLGWTLTIIEGASTAKQIALFDGRVHCFPYVTPMPHLNWASYIGGIMQFNRKSKSEKLQATGSFGGFRSTSFISMLLQVYYSIGVNDDVLGGSMIHTPTGNNKALHNVRGKVLMAIECVLDAYFDCKRREWRPDYISEFQKKLSSLSVHMLLVWDLKQAIVNPLESKITVNKMRNIHKLEHLSMYIKRWGSLIHLDTSTFESYHKIGTTGIWNKTSKRHSAIFEEMTQRISIHDYQRLLKLRQDIVDDKHQCHTPIEGVTFRKILNRTSFEFYLTYDYSEDIAVEQHWLDNWSLVCAQQCLNSPSNLTKFLRKYKFHEIVQNEYSLQWDLSFNQIYKMSIIPGVLYKSDDESGMGNGTIYACSRFNYHDAKGHKDKPRYDYVFINYGDLEPVLARILLFVQISTLNGDISENGDAKILVLIQHLIRIPSSGSTLGNIYEFASDPNDKNLFRFDIITIQSILRPAFVVPVFRQSYNPLSHSSEDRFWVLDRSFFDRSGWETRKPSSEDEDLNTAIKQKEYIKRHQTANRILNLDSSKTHVVQEDDNDVGFYADEYDSDAC